MTVIKPPTQLEDKYETTAIFLAGSIEMDSAERWQDKAESLIKKHERSDIIVFNPRREFWDGTVDQSMDNPYFREQVEWELDALSKSSWVIMYFDPNTKSPISLLELGLFARANKLIVICPQGFWRKGNVDIVCQRFHIPQVSTLEEAIIKILN